MLYQWLFTCRAFSLYAMHELDLDGAISVFLGLYGKKDGWII